MGVVTPKIRLSTGVDPQMPIPLPQPLILLEARREDWGIPQENPQKIQNRKKKGENEQKNEQKNEKVDKKMTKKIILLVLEILVLMQFTLNFNMKKKKLDKRR